MSPGTALVTGAGAGIGRAIAVPGWVETEAVKHTLEAITAEEIEVIAFPPPEILIQPEEIGDLVLMFVRDESLARRGAVAARTSR